MAHLLMSGCLMRDCLSRGGFVHVSAPRPLALMKNQRYIAWRQCRLLFAEVEWTPTSSSLPLSRDPMWNLELLLLMLRLPLLTLDEFLVNPLTSSSLSLFLFDLIFRFPGIRFVVVGWVLRSFAVRRLSLPRFFPSNFFWRKGEDGDRKSGNKVTWMMVLRGVDTVVGDTQNWRVAFPSVFAVFGFETVHLVSAISLLLLLTLWGLVLGFLLLGDVTPWHRRLLLRRFLCLRKVEGKGI